MRKPLLSLFLITSTAFATISAKFGDRTENPQKYVLKHAEFSDRGLTQFDCNKCTALKDALFVAATNSCGTGGCDYYVFRKKDNTYEYLGSIFLQVGAFEFLSSINKGLPSIKVYTHLSATEGSINEFQYNGKGYEKIGKSKIIKSSELEKNVKSESVTIVQLSKDLKPIVQ